MDTTPRRELDMTMPNPQPPNAMPKCARRPFIEQRQLAEDEKRERQDRKQKALGEAVLRQLKLR